MRRTFKKNLVSTKEAGELFGYNSDYISSLARSHKIVSKREGHSWLVDKISLEAYLKLQADLKLNRERALASKRAAEYHAHFKKAKKPTPSPSTPVLHLVSNENLITTKEAGELSKYSSDYLARLIR